MNKQKGITLIALVITIIVLLILAGISIASLTGENGILGKAQIAGEKTKEVGAKEKVQVAVMGSYGEDGKLNHNELKVNLDKVEGIDRSTVPPIITEDSFDLIVRVDSYHVVIKKNGEVIIEEAPIISDKPNTEGKWDGEVNSPKLTEDMIAVYWKEDGTEVTGDAGENWYHYKAGDNQTDTKDSKWANAKTEDGSYWVWIPRYEYKILSGEGTSTAGKIDVKFIPTSQTTPDEGYKIHPAFQDGTNNNFKNGEWDSELSGIWVAKYEASRSDASISSVGTSETMKVVPNVHSWTNITVGDSYTVAMNYDRSKESHMMKNSEWGAVAYLTQSQYGRNGHEIDINNSSTLVTGNGGGSPNVGEAEGITNAYYTEEGARASTTGNISGIYDLSGGAYERVAAFISNGNSYLSSYGGKLTEGKTIANPMGYDEWSTKYVTVYLYDILNDSATNNYISYKNAGYGYGDAILEISENGAGSTSWYESYSHFPYESGPFISRGGGYSKGKIGGSIFYFSSPSGNANNSYSFRAVLMIEM